MKTITEQIVEHLEQLANEWSDHTPQCEALFMAAKEALTFQDKEKEMLSDVWLEAQVAYQGGADIKPSNPTFDEYYEETFNTKEKMRTPPAYGALGFSKRQATALINGVSLFYTK
jgi:hypothetical protein